MNKNTKSKISLGLDSRREFIKTSAVLAGAVSLIGINPLFAATNDKKGDMEFITLNNGVTMPILGFGTLKLGKDTQKAVEWALECGYRLFDTAQSYANEEGVGAALKATGIKREELFITSKVFAPYVNEQKLPPSFEISLKKLNVDYVDLLLIHQPVNDTYGAWRAMSKLYKQKRTRAIGVSNFYPYRLVDFIMNNEIKPQVNQVECHPFFQDIEGQKIMQEWGIAMEGWSPFAQGGNNIFNNATLKSIANKYNKSVAQVVLRWHIQRNIIAIPRSHKLEHIKENFNVFDFALDSADMQSIASLETHKRLLDHHDANRIKWFNERKAGENLGR